MLLSNADDFYGQYNGEFDGQGSADSPNLTNTSPDVSAVPPLVIDTGYTIAVDVNEITGEPTDTLAGLQNQGIVGVAEPVAASSGTNWWVLALLAAGVYYASKK